MTDGSPRASESRQEPALPRRRLLALAGGSLTAGLAGCSSDGDGTDTPAGTPPGSADGTTATTTEGSTTTPEPGTTVPGTTEPTTTEPETFYTVGDQQLWEIVRGTVDGLTVEDGLLSATGDSDGGRFETFTFVGDRPRDLRVRIHETPLWDTWVYQGRLREVTDGQAQATTDSVMFVDMDAEYPYKISGLQGFDGHVWWQSEDFENWEEVCAYREHPTDSWGGGTNYQFGRFESDGSIRIYGSFNDDATSLWRGEDVCSLERQGEVHPNPDSGGFYEPETDTWHLYYEAEGEIPYNGGPTSNALGHSTSSSGTNLDDWEDQGNIVDLSEMDEHTGDPEVIQVGDTYFMFIDFSINHPDYRQAVLTSEDLYDWTFQGQASRERGGDFTVRYIPDRGDFVALAEFAPGGGLSVFTSPGPVSPLRATLSLGEETFTAEREIEYGIGEDMSQITTTGSETAHTWTAEFDTVVPAGQPYTITIETSHPGTRIEGFELVG
jgi:hypothetical protein